MTTSSIEMCAVRIGEDIFGMPITHILEILGSVCPQPVPLAPDFVGGIVHYRGDVLTTIDLRRLLGLPQFNRPQDILVLDGHGACFGLLVDSVCEVLSVSDEDYEPNPSTLDDSKKSLFSGAYKLRESLLIMLDPERLDPFCLGTVHAA
jgi:purine-binding chemotaxis protein CheW